MRSLSRLRVPRPGAMVVGALAAWAGGCKHDQARSLLPIDISASSDLTDLRRVTILIGKGATEYVNRTLDWSGQTLQVGYHLPADVEGEVLVWAKGLDGVGSKIAESNHATTTVKPGATAAGVTLLLVPNTGPDNPDAGAKADAGGDGNSDRASQPGGDAAGDGTWPVRRWYAGENLQKDDPRSVTDPSVAIDPAGGNVLCAWSGGGAVNVRRFDGPTSTWGKVQTIDAQGDPSGVRVAQGSGGHVLAVWYQYDPDGKAPLRGLWESHSTNGGDSWTTAARVQMAWITSVEVAMSDAGEARVAWEAYELPAGQSYPIITLWSATYQAATGMFANIAVVKDAGTDTTAREPRIVMNRAGNGILAWQQLDGAGQESVWASSFSGALPLGPQLLDTNTTDRIFTHNVAMAPDGDKGVVVWSEAKGANQWLMFDEHDAAGWAGPRGELSSGGIAGPAVAIDGAGVVTAAWSQRTGGGYNVASARRTPGAGWSAAEPLETTSVADSDSGEWAEPQLAVDGDNDVHAVWRRKVSTTKLSFDLVARRFARGAWEPETVLGHKDTMRTYHPRLAVANDGRAAAAFYFFTLIGDPDTTETEGYRAFVALYR